MDSNVNPLRLIILGSGTSTGIPEVGCGCEVCMSRDVRDKRLRCSSLMITPAGKRILIDCGPDFRQQALRMGLDYLDAILLTHEHYDHIGGLDDLRTIAWQREIPIYAEANVIESIKKRLHYYFRPNPYLGTPRLILNEIHPDAPFQVEDVKICPIRVMHGKLPILGFRVGDLTYITDLKTIELEEIRKFADTRVLIMNGLRVIKPHPTHQSFREAEEFVLCHLRPDVQCFYTHLSHHAPLHEIMEQTLPEGQKPAYDGMEILVSEDNIISQDYQPECLPMKYEDWGLIRYVDALERQHQYFSEALAAKQSKMPVSNRFILCEHHPVITLGLHAKAQNLLVNETSLKARGVDLFHIERGGDVTYHAPGQLVGYPIIDLEKFHLSLKGYIHFIEQGIIDLLLKYDIKAERKDGATGVWIDVGLPGKERKICAIGVKSSRYVTMHGFALNVTTDLSGFNLINPCGFVGGRTTSIQLECNYPIDMNVVIGQLTDIYTKMFRNLLNLSI